MCENKLEEKEQGSLACHQCGEDADLNQDGEEPTCTRCSRMEQEIKETNRWLYYHER